jgi:hypothetical protein
MNVEIGTEAAQLPEKEYISGIFLAVWQALPYSALLSTVFSNLEEIERGRNVWGREEEKLTHNFRVSVPAASLELGLALQGGPVTVQRVPHLSFPAPPPLIE